MKKNTLIALLVAAVLVIAGALYYYIGQKDSLPVGQNTEQSKLVNEDFEITLPE